MNFLWPCPYSHFSSLSMNIWVTAFYSQVYSWKHNLKIACSRLSIGNAICEMRHCSELQGDRVPEAPYKSPGTEAIHWTRKESNFALAVKSDAANVMRNTKSQLHQASKSYSSLYFLRKMPQARPVWPRKEKVYHFQEFLLICSLSL